VPPNHPVPTGSKWPSCTLQYGGVYVGTEAREYTRTVSCAARPFKVTKLGRNRSDRKILLQLEGYLALAAQFVSSGRCSGSCFERTNRRRPSQTAGVDEGKSVFGSLQSGRVCGGGVFQVHGLLV